MNNSLDFSQIIYNNEVQGDILELDSLLFNSDLAKKNIGALIKYSFHFTTYCDEIIRDLMDSDNQHLKRVYNCIRFLTINLIGNFNILCLRRINKEILQRYGSQFFSNYIQIRSKIQKWNQGNKRFTYRILLSHTKVLEYLSKSKLQQNNKNSKQIQKIKQKHPQLFIMFHEINKSYSDHPDEKYDFQDIFKLYQYILELTTKQIFPSTYLQSQIKSISKKFNDQDRYEIEKDELQYLINKKNFDFQKEYFSLILINMKLLNMIFVTPYYSFNTEIENIRTFLSNEVSNPQDFHEVFNNLDNLYIYKSKRLNFNRLIKKRKTMPEATLFTLKMNKLILSIFREPMQSKFSQFFGSQPFKSQENKPIIPQMTGKLKEFQECHSYSIFNREESWRLLELTEKYAGKLDNHLNYLNRLEGYLQNYLDHTD